MKVKIVIWYAVLWLLSCSAATNYEVSPDVFLRLYQIMKDTHELFQKHNLIYWVHAGTLLGAVRHNGIIPWDDDLDIIIRSEDHELFVSLIPELEALGYRIQKYPVSYKIIHSKEGLGNICIDLNLFVKDKYGNYAYPPSSGMPYYFKISELFPLREYNFGEIKVMGPQNSIPYLDRTYPKWQQQAVMYNHHNNKPQTVVLTAELLQYARPTGPLEDRVNKGWLKNNVNLDASPCIICQASEEDAEVLAELLGQLGFPQGSSQMCLEKIRSISQSALDKIWVVKMSDMIIGCLCLNVITPFYTSGLFARVDAIVVNEEYRKLGIGKLLMEHAENYAKSVGCKRIFLTSGNHRPEAHEFYKHIGYVNNATYFVKYLESNKDNLVQLEC